jgi:AmmeMemoRadiSam system protein A
VHADDRTRLLELAAGAIEHGLRTGRMLAVDITEVSATLAAPGASFVTLERDERLLGCIGTIRATRPLALDVASNAVAAAFSDPRLPPVTEADYAAMSIKVSVLSEPEPVAVASYEELHAVVRPGTDGLLVEAGRFRATFLPAVWAKVAGAEEFLALLWRKAGLPPQAWPAGLTVARYTTDEFGHNGSGTSNPTGVPQWLRNDTSCTGRRGATPHRPVG